MKVSEQILHSLMNSSFVAPVPEGNDAKLQESKKLLESVQEAVKHLENINNRHQRLEITMTNPSIDELQLMIDEGYISCEGKIGKKFERAHPKGSKDKIAYGKMGRDAKKQFRLTWAKKEIQNMKETFSKGGGGELEKEEEVEKVDWVVYNSMTERYEFLYVKN